MKKGSKDPTISFLKKSFIALIIVSVLSFTFLGISTGNMSEDAIHEIADVYMDGMNTQMTSHFESVIGLRFEQTNGIVTVVGSNYEDMDELYSELSYRAEVRGFEYLALCSGTGEFESISGKKIKPLNPGPFLDGVKQGEQRVAIGEDSDGNQVVLFGVDAHYPIKNGETSTALITAISVDYIKEFLEIDKESNNKMITYHILRKDGSFVIKNADETLIDFFNQVGNHKYENNEEGTEAKNLVKALQDHEKYSGDVSAGDEQWQIYVTPMPYSEWYIVSMMSHDFMNDTVAKLTRSRIILLVIAISIAILILVIIFFKYFAMTRKQIHELEEAERIAVEASHAKSEFLANMSHDIRTPMNAIMGMTEIAINRTDDREQVKIYLNKINMSSKYLLGLINDILDMSKIESGKLELIPAQVSLREVLDEVVAIIQPLIKAKNQKFEIQLEDVDYENIWCDGVRINQVMLNILSNATKYTNDEGLINLHIREEESPKGDKYVRLHINIKDNGIGMSKEFQEKLYDSYTRADAKRINKIEGVGLGMAITKYIVDAMDGKIEVESELDKGTEFHLTFDFEKADISEEEMVLPPWDILVVDDDRMLCRTVSDTLMDMGIKHADYAYDGEEALKMVKSRHDYQIILMDMKMPGMNGIEIAKAIREKYGESMPILLITSYDWSEFEKEARSVGINGFISKPLFRSTLYYSLRNYMDIEEQEDVEEETSYFHGKRILLAEDNELNREIATELLSELGPEIEGAEDGKICLDMFKASEEGYYDAILMDIRMPNMTGYEATEAIRALDRKDAKEIPIIAMSADVFAEDVKRCLDCGMNAHTVKPIDIGNIVKLLEKYMK